MSELECFSFYVMWPPCSVCKDMSCFSTPPSPVLKAQQCQGAGNCEVIPDTEWQSHLLTQGEGAAWTRLGVEHTMSGAENHTRKPGRCQMPKPVSGAGCGLWRSPKDARLFAEHPDGPRVRQDRTAWALQQMFGGGDASNGRGSRVMPGILSTDASSGWLQPRGQNGLEPWVPEWAGVRKEELVPEETQQGTFHQGHYTQDSLGEWPKLNTLVFPLLCCPRLIKALTRYLLITWKCSELLRNRISQNHWRRW